MDQNLNTNAVTLTKTLCTHLAGAHFGDLSAAAKREARRGVLDWIGCALAGSGHRTITTLLGVLQETSGKPAATVLGRNLKLGLLDAPLANGQMGHVLDYDDTHMGGVVLHTSSPVLAALFALAERAPVQRRGFHAGLRGGLRGRRSRRPHRAGPPQGRLASHRHARQHRGGGCRRQAARARPAAADLRDGDRGNASRRHAAEPRHHVQVAARRQGGEQRRAGGAAGRARLRFDPGDHRRQARASPASTATPPSRSI